MGERISDEALRRSVSLASPGPWRAEPMTGRGAWIAAADGNWAALSCGETDRLGEANAHLIALAPALAAEVLQLREALAFYADQNHLRLPSEGPWGANSTDFGKVARAALTGGHSNG